MCGFGRIPADRFGVWSFFVKKHAGGRFQIVASKKRLVVFRRATEGRHTGHSGFLRQAQDMLMVGETGGKSKGGALRSDASVDGDKSAASAGQRQSRFKPLGDEPIARRPHPHRW